MGGWMGGWVDGGGDGADRRRLFRRSVHNALEKHRYGGAGGSGGAGGGGAPPWLIPVLSPLPGRRRAQLRCCLERLKQQVPLGTGPARSSTLSLLHRARLHIQVRGAAGPGTAPGILRGSRAAQLGPRSRLPGSPQRLQEQELRARRAKDRLRDRQQSLRRRLELLLLPTDGERARADSLDSSRLSEPSEGGKRGQRIQNEGGQGGKAAQGVTRPLPMPRGCRGRGGWRGVQRGAAAQLWHREGAQLLQPPQPRILTVPSALPAAANPARVRGHSWVAPAVALRARSWHRAVAPAGHWKRCWKTPGCHQDTLLPPPVHPGHSGWVWGGAAHCRHGCRKAPLALERQEGELSAFSNLLPLPPRSLVQTRHFIVKELGKTLACVFPAQGWTSRVESSTGLCSSQANLSQIRGGSRFFNDNYISERVKQQLIVRLIQFL